MKGETGVTPEPRDNTGITLLSHLFVLVVIIWIKIGHLSYSVLDFSCKGTFPLVNLSDYLSNFLYLYQPMKMATLEGKS